MPITPQPGCEVVRCHLNVKAVVAERGGGEETGWSMWNLADLWLEADPHAVWVTPDGERIDVTPDPHGETRRLFLPDSEIKFEGYPIRKQYHPLRSGSEIERAIALNTEAESIFCRYATDSPDAIAPDDLQKIKALKQQVSAIVSRIIVRLGR